MAMEGIWCKDSRTSVVGRGSTSELEVGASGGGGGRPTDSGFRHPLESFPCSASDPSPTQSPSRGPSTVVTVAHSLRHPACGPPDGSQLSAGETRVQFSRIRVTPSHPSALAGLENVTATDDSGTPEVVTSNLSSSGPGSGRRGRGRPPGSGPRQVLAALGGWFALSAGGNFTPHIVTVPTGEDVASRILSFSRKGPRAICILSANGAVSNVTLRPPGPSGATLTYEGRFEILSLSGSFTISVMDGIRSRTGGISVSLAGPDGRVIGGGVAGLLVAASPIQVVVGSFLPNIMKEYKSKSTTPCTSPAIDRDAMSIDNHTSHVVSDGGCLTQSTPSAAPGEVIPEMDDERHPISAAAFKVDIWQGSHTAAENKSSPDINVCLPGEQ